ncbi:hypothetical protein HPB47_013993 [Ixodes persulcatus]|uniref:Uncharacterized protein n=1 Tax=Ixodes persulcatus TaxID=34615 RepID=A0AC60QXE4_IXOPE|nr:hypothetical protein HPB47_013993 [Ixodes persulcatus]
MQSGHHEGRRRARTKHLTKMLKGDPNVWYVDASPYRDRQALCAAITNFPGDARAACTIPTGNVTDAEEVAIALAVAHIARSGKKGTIVSDSQTAIRNYMRGRISPAAFRILSSTPSWDTTIPIRLIWTPAHAELEGNEQAHELAGELANQVDDQGCFFFPVPITSYRDILYYYKETWKTYPEPHPALGRHHATILRQIQTNTLPNPVLFSKIHPDLYAPTCHTCGGWATIKHILWQCPRAQKDSFIKNEQEWEAAVISPSREVQLALVDLAVRAGEPRSWILGPDLRKT